MSILLFVKIWMETNKAHKDTEGGRERENLCFSNIAFQMYLMDWKTKGTGLIVAVFDGIILAVK